MCFCIGASSNQTIHSVFDTSNCTVCGPPSNPLPSPPVVALLVLGEGGDVWGGLDVEVAAGAAWSAAPQEKTSVSRVEEAGKTLDNIK